MSDPRPDVWINFTRESSASFTRPNNTSTYTIGDAVTATTPAVMEFTNCARKDGGAGVVRGVVLKKSRTFASDAVFRLHLYTAAPTPVADNNPFQTLWAVAANHIGYVDLTMTQEGGTDETPTAFAVVNLPFVCTESSTKLYGVLVARAAFPPYALEVFLAKLLVEAF